MLTTCSFHRRYFMRNSIGVLAALFVLAGLNSTPAFALDVQIGELKDSRTTGQFFKGLEVQLKLVGDGFTDAKALRATVSSATDSTGQNLINSEETSQKEFKEISNFGGSSDNTVTLKFLNPARKAESLKELKGEIELFIPKNDPQSTVTLAGSKNWAGKLIDHPALKNAGVELKILTAAQQQENAKKESEEKIALMKKEGAPQEMIDFAMQMAGGFGGNDENSLTLSLKDPKNSLVSIEFVDASGQKIDSNGSMSSMGSKTLYFGSKVPDDASAVIHILSSKALVKVPIQLANVTLP